MIMGSIAAFVLKLSVPWVFAVILLDEYIKFPLIIYRYRTYKWLQDVTR